MTSTQARNCYRQVETNVDIHPVKLIHLMYERVLKLLDMTREGVEKNDPRQRGENLGKAIAIIAELNASVKEDDDSEAAAFLRGLYGAILTELPKVAADNDLETLRRARGYISRLKEIWEETAMKEHGLLARQKGVMERGSGHPADVADGPEAPPAGIGLSVSI